MKTRTIMKKSRMETLQAQRDSAMPEVKKLVKQYGRTVIGWCVHQLADYEKKARALERMKSEVEKMERELR